MTCAPAATPAAGPPDAWNRWAPGWHAAFWLLMGVGALRLLVADLPASGRWSCAALLALLGLAYLRVRPGPGNVTRWQAYPYLLTGVVAIGVLTGVDPAFGFLLFLLYPHSWVYSDTRWEAIGWNVALTISAGIGYAAAADWNEDGLRDIAGDMAVSLAFSVLLGLWIYRIIEESAQRAELIRQLELARAELSEAHHAQGVMAERERMAREIHDTLAQGFTSIVMLAQAAEPQPALIEQVARDNLAEARALVAAFSPLESSTLVEALSRLVTRFREETGLPVEVDLADTPALSRDREVVLLRVVQEALTNVRRHSRASRVTVRLVADPAGARVEVVDDGVGFGPDRHEGYGLAGIRGRVDEAGGSVDVASAPGRGTHVTVRVPA